MTYKFGSILFFTASALALATTARAQVSVTYAGYTDLLDASAQVSGQPGQTQQYGPSDENPFNHTANASDSYSDNAGNSAMGQASVSLNLSYSSTSVRSTAISAVSVSGDEGVSAVTESDYRLNITVTQPVQYTLTATTSVTNEQSAYSVVTFQGGDANVRFASGSNFQGYEASGTATGILEPGVTYQIEQGNEVGADNDYLFVPSASFSSSVDLEFTPVVPEPATWLGGSLLVGVAGATLRRRDGFARTIAADNA